MVYPEQLNSRMKDFYDIWSLATHLFLRSQVVSELAPYLCLTDDALFGVLGIELTRTQRLANGGERCDFRFKWGGEMSSGWPPPWLES